ncbi:MAG: hypothetical protein CVV27_17470 [Candidatus Melainabacteria bacterium HGW-Melainabacteria-1]|nr:MAG: hypothetical protein CVV27_17470 [Candidatus Melainabacteria bacterium HGW-Melainabacteria-1]
MNNLHPAKPLLILAISLQLIGCAANQPKSDDGQPQASAAPVAELTPPSPDDAEGLYAYALKLGELGKDAEALSHYLQATQVNPEHLKAHIALAQLYTKGNRKDEARVAYENVLRLDRTHPFVAQYKEARLKYYSAQNIAQNEEYDKALKLLTEAPRGTPMDDEIAAKEKEWQGMMQSGSDIRRSQEIVEQASLLAYQGKYAEAIELIKTAPDADKNTTVQDKLQQWQKAMQSQPVPGESVAPPVVSNTRKQQYVQGDDVNLRQSPYLYAESLGTLKQGSAVEVLLDKGYEADGYQWSKVRTTDGKVGWVAANLLSGSLSRPTSPITQPSNRPPVQTSAAPEQPTRTYGTRYVKSDNVNVRRSPALKGTLVTRVMDGAPVIVLSEDNIQADGYAWTKVKLSDGQIGWIAANFLRGPSQSPPAIAATPQATATAKPSTPAQPVARTAHVTGSDINVRSGPDLKSSVVTMVSTPTKVTLLGDKPVRQGSLVWQKVKLPGGKTGWITTAYLGSAKPGASAQTANARRIIRGDNVNVRTDPSTGAKVLTRATEGTPVTLMSTTPVKKDGYSWYKIRLADGRIGWIASNFLGK